MSYVILFILMGCKNINMKDIIDDNKFIIVLLENVESL